MLGGHLLRVECYIPKSQDWYWIWTYNRSNTHEGFFEAPVTYGLEPCLV
ncbi:hypothetical protein [Lentzea terrae]|nr:hypothetical protein [Lentzea terrae]